MTDFDNTGLFDDLTLNDPQYPWLEASVCPDMDLSLTFQTLNIPTNDGTKPIVGLPRSSYDPFADLDWGSLLTSTLNPASTIPPNVQATHPLSPHSPAEECHITQMSPTDFEMTTSPSFAGLSPASSFSSLYLEPTIESAYPSPIPSPIDFIQVEYPEPANPDSSEQEAETPAPKRSESNSPQQPVVPVRRRGPGRPCKSQVAAMQSEEKRPTGRALVTMRRQIHNDSAMRSRARFNTVLDELWNEVPEDERSKALAKSDPTRQLSRAEKIEVVISFVRRLRVEANARCRY